MNESKASAQDRHESKTKLLDAALKVIREKGYAATRVEDVCAAAGLTKGSFFYHFSTKEDLALAAVDYWSETTGGLFAAASYNALADPVDRLLAYLDFRKALLAGDLPQITCLAGTMTQEIYATHPALRKACAASIADHADTLVADIATAMDRRGVEGVTAEGLALYMQAVLQGAFILAKAKQNSEIAADCIDHLRRYLSFLFRDSRAEENQHAGEKRDQTEFARRGRNIRPAGVAAGRPSRQKR